jgi:hypothetical protein
VTPLERLVSFVAAQYRWGLHPLKLLVALVLPIAFVWIADRRIRQRSEELSSQEEKLSRLPRIRRH